MIRVVAILLFLGAVVPSFSQQPLNIVLVILDDMKLLTGETSEDPRSFLRRIYPDPSDRAAVASVLSPHIDALAAEGVLFANTYAAASLCNPSRSAFLTGWRTHISKVQGNAFHFRDSTNPAVSGSITLPQNLKQQGYFTAGVGKVFHRSRSTTIDWPDTNFSWNVWINRATGPSPPFTNDTYSVTNFPNLQFGTAYGQVTDQRDYFNANFIAELLESGWSVLTDQESWQDTLVSLPANTPFFLACGILLPHDPRYAPSDILEMFPEDDIQIDSNLLTQMEADLDDIHPDGLEQLGCVMTGGGPQCGEFSILMNNGLAKAPDGDIQAWKSFVRHYLASVRVADECLGRILEGLENGPHASNTMVVVIGDHGFDLGEKMHVGKSTIWETSTSTLMIIRDPTQPQSAGQVCKRIVSLMDLYRTCSAKAGVSVPEYVAGRDLSYLIADPTAKSREPALMVIKSNDFALRTEEYRYIRFNNSRARPGLYDAVNDPYELTNLATDPSYSNTLDRLDALYSDCQSKWDPPRISPISGEIGEAFQVVAAGSTQRTYVVESSTNYLDWVPRYTNTVYQDPIRFTDPESVSSSHLTYRAMETP